MIIPDPDILCFEIRKVNALHSCDTGWYWDSSINLGTFAAAYEQDVRRKFIRELKKLGITFKPNRTLIYDYGDLLEIVDRKTKEPLFAALML